MREVFEDRLGSFRAEGYTAIPFLRYKTNNVWLVRVWHGYDSEMMTIIADKAREAATLAIQGYDSYHEEQLLASQVAASQEKSG